MGDAGASGIEGKVREGYSVFFLGAGGIAFSTAKKLIEKASIKIGEEQIILTQIPKPREIIFYSRGYQKRNFGEGVRNVKQKISDERLKIVVKIPDNYVGDDKVRAIMQTNPDVTVIAIRGDEEAKWWKDKDRLKLGVEKALDDRLRRAKDNFSELEKYAGTFSGYKGVVNMVTNPPDPLAQAFCEATGLEPKQVNGFTEIDSLTLRRYLFINGHIFKEEEFIGIDLPKEVKTPFLNLCGFGLGKLEKYVSSEDKGVLTNLAAFVIGAHGPDLVPILSGLGEEERKAIEDAMKKRGFEGTENILKQIGHDVGLIRTFYTVIKEKSHDVPLPLSEFIDAIGSVSASKKDLKEQKCNDYARGVSPTASAYIRPQTTPSNIWFGSPVNIRFDQEEGRTKVEPISARRDKEGNEVYFSPEETKLISEAYERHAEKVRAIAKEIGREMGIELPLGEKQKPFVRNLGDKLLLYAQCEGLQNARVYAYDINANTFRTSPDGKKYLLFRAVGLKGVKCIDVHRINNNDYWLAGHKDGFDIIAPDGTLRRFKIHGSEPVDSSLTLENRLLVSEQGAGLHAIDTTRPFEEWEAVPLETEKTRTARELNSWGGTGYYRQERRLKKIVGYDCKFKTENVFDTFDAQITAYDIDRTTGILFAGGINKERRTVVCTKNLLTEEQIMYPVEMTQKINKLVVGRHKENVLLVFLTKVGGYCVTENEVKDNKLTARFLRECGYEVKEPKRLTLDAENKMTYLLSKGKLVRWDMEKGGELAIAADITTVILT